jgi:hypothetical protein
MSHIASANSNRHFVRNTVDVANQLLDAIEQDLSASKAAVSHRDALKLGAERELAHLQAQLLQARVRPPPTHSLTHPPLGYTLYSVLPCHTLSYPVSDLTLQCSAVQCSDMTCSTPALLVSFSCGARALPYPAMMFVVCLTQCGTSPCVASSCVVLCRVGGNQSLE